MVRRFLTVLLAFGLAATGDAQTNEIVPRPSPGGEFAPSSPSGATASLVSKGTVTPLHSVGPITSSRLAGEALCGPEIVTVGDAWEYMQLETAAMRELLRTNDLVRLPQK